MRYVPPELKAELNRLKEQRKRYQIFLDNPRRLKMAIKKLDFDINNYEKALGDTIDSIFKEKEKNEIQNG